MTRFLIRLLCLWTASLAVLHAEPVSARLSSHFLVRGEEAWLEYRLPPGVSPQSAITPPSINGINIRQEGPFAMRIRGYGRRNDYAFQFRVSSYQPGDYTIPPARIETENGVISTESVNLRVIHETELEWKTAQVGNTTFRYSAAFRTTDASPFVNEVIPVEMKIYVPATQRIEDWGVPEFEREGVAAWRFEPRPGIGRAELPGGSSGGTYYAVSYPSTLSPLREGTVSIGPATLRLITIQTSLNRFSMAEYRPVNLDVTGIELNARPLPEGAPEGFDNAVGQFELSVAAEETEIREGDPVTLSIMVAGSGNLDSIEPPSLSDPDGWKIYPASRIESPDRREISGLTVFRQFLRPERLIDRVPPYRFVYFDPEAEDYRTLTSEAIPLQVMPSTQSPLQGATVPPEQPVPLEEMTDILGIIPSADRLGAARESFNRPWWHLIPLALALVLLARIVQLHFVPKVRPDPDRVARRRDLRDLSAASTGDPRTFYRRAGAFIEKWLGESDAPLAREVLVRRDEICFTKEVPESSIPTRERHRIIRGLRKLALPVAVILAGLGMTDGARAEDQQPTAEGGAEAAYHESRFAEAADLWLESAPWERLSADVLYNIGNAAYRLGSPGEAALFWRRAILKDGTHPEAQQNLRFLERKFGSITVRRPDYQYALTKVPARAWENAIWVGTWLAGLGLLVFPATRTGARLRIAAVASLVTAPLVAAIGWLGLHYYPDDARFASAREQGVILADRADVRTDAARNAPLVIEAPAGSLCRILHTSGDWTYVAFTNDTRGWVPADQVAPVIVNQRPQPPSRPQSSENNGKNA